ncbi:hypothetical protein [Planctobacterium marinum]|uniref:Uncharacterized protein n=1 Tax=Planctobacterium marinum TaxID=1631968 RepID=A0AA48KQH1_9ALTE|nr:hypothetical protein MACH26_20190 [Planctobacterium marinum]
MNIKTLLLASLIAVQANANETEKAPKDLISEVIGYCKDMAADEQIGSALLSAWLLECVNAELEAEGYAPIQKLPKK